MKLLLLFSLFLTINNGICETLPSERDSVMVNPHAGRNIQLHRLP